MGLQPNYFQVAHLLAKQGKMFTDSDLNSVRLQQLKKHVHVAIALSGVGKELRGRDEGGNVTNVQCKSNRNCHYESPPPNNEYILIKNLL
jgi:hypothetical protein